MKAENFKNLGSFLADHFGGYPDIETASKDSGYDTFEQYLEAFCWSVGEPKDLVEAESFLAQFGHPGGWDEMRKQFFSEGGNVNDPRVPKGLREIVNMNN